MTKNSGTKKTFGGLGIVPETLSEDNYEHCKRCLKNYLVGHGLWGVVSGKESEPSKHEKQEHDEWKKKNALALHAIQLSCGETTYSKFDEQAHLSANYAWTHLAVKASQPRDRKEVEEEEDDDNFQVKDNGVKEHLDYEPLYRAIEEDNWHATEEFLRDNPNALKARISSHNDTALHIAILSGHINLALKLVSKMDPCDLELTNDCGATALSLAAVCGAKNLAKALVNKNRDLVKLSNDHDDGQLPVIVAALYGQKEMVHYLYKVTPEKELCPKNGMNGVRLLNCLITADIYDVASELLKRHPKLGVTPDHSGNYALRILAHKPSAFRSGTKFTLWGELIYKLGAKILSPWDGQRASYDEESLESQTLGSDADHKIAIDESSEKEMVNTAHGGLVIYKRVHELLHKLGWSILKGIVPEIKYIHERKLVNDEAVKLLSCMFEEMRKLSKLELENMDIDTIIYDAIKHGITEFIREMLKYMPDIIWKKDKIGRTIFSHALVLHQHEIFSLIYGLGTRARIMAQRHDIFGNNYLHLAAKLSPPSQLEKVSGAGLQMQGELQWFKEVESIVQPKLKEEVNENNKRPETLFSDEHKKLAKDAESWMKSTAGSCMIVGTLIAAVMFTAAFTVPGGNDSKTGLPTMLNNHPRPFLIFMVSNALSMYSSCTSLIMFLGILTARFAEEDFLTALPSNLSLGIECLFVSIITMLSSFGAALYLTLHDQLSWITIPIIILSVIPIVVFDRTLYVLVLEMFITTQRSGILGKTKKNLH